jgi:8-oxo-dGTP pyrophosphatase MutT (NUDIX family)
VTSNSNRDRWIIPAGHVEDGETPEQAALREVMEEAGVLAEIKLGLGNFQYPWFRNKQWITIDTCLYLMEYLETIIINPEGRNVRFFAYDEIKTLNIWDESKEFLQKAHQLR